MWGSWDRNTVNWLIILINSTNRGTPDTLGAGQTLGGEVYMKIEEQFNDEMFFTILLGHTSKCCTSTFAPWT